MILLLFAALAAALVCASRLEGAQASGVIVGTLMGSGLSGLSFLYQRHVLLTRPEKVMQAAVVGFLVKLSTLLLGALAFRFVEPAGARVDWVTFVVAYGASVALVLPLATHLALREQRRRAAHAAGA